MSMSNNVDITHFLLGVFSQGVILSISNSSSLLVASSKLKSGFTNVFISTHDVYLGLCFLFNFLLLQTTSRVIEELNA
jgi:hypothetical protein